MHFVVPIDYYSACPHSVCLDVVWTPRKRVIKQNKKYLVLTASETKQYNFLIFKYNF